LNPIETLDGIAEKIAPGRTPAYTSAQVLKAIELISGSGVGRQQLAGRLGIGEGSARTMVKHLSAEGLIVTTREGMMLTEKGIRLLDELHKQISFAELTNTGVTVGMSDYAVLVRGVIDCVRFGVEQRDSAFIAGAKGATTLVFDGMRFHIPGMDIVPQPELGDELIGKFKPEVGDVVIIGTADNLLFAEIGAKSSALELLRMCK